MRKRPIIYDSRNYLVLIDSDAEANIRLIYDSRNYLVLIDVWFRSLLNLLIYDSRNYLVLIDTTIVAKTVVESTIVEII